MCHREESVAIFNYKSLLYCVRNKASLHSQ